MLRRSVIDFRIIALAVALTGNILFAQTYWSVETLAGNGLNEWTGEGVFSKTAGVGQGFSLEYHPGQNRLYLCLLDLDDTEPVNRIAYIDLNNETVHTFIGDGTWGFVDSISRTSARVSGPGSMAFDAAGNLFFTEFRGNRVMELHATTDEVYHICGKGPGVGSAILNFNLSNSGLGYYQADQIGSWAPLGMAISPADGMVYWVEFATIKRLNSITGIVEIFCGDTVVGSEMAIDGDIAAFEQQIDPLGSITFDAAGNLFFATLSHTIQRIDVTSKEITTVVGLADNDGYNGDGPVASTMLDQPYGLKFAPNGVLHWVEKENGMVRKLENDSVITVIGKAAVGIGNINQNYNGEHINADSVRMRPYDLEFGPNGEIFVMDFKNYRVRKFYQCTSPQFAGVSKSDFQLCHGDSVEIFIDGTLGSAIQWTLTAASCDSLAIDSSNNSAPSVWVKAKRGSKYFVATQTAAPGCNVQHICHDLEIDTECNNEFHVFSPNSDGVNDFVHLRIAEIYPDNIVNVVNRYGDIIHTIQDYDNLSNVWAGERVVGGNAKEGTYYILFQGFVEGQVEEYAAQSNWVQLIR